PPVILCPADLQSCSDEVPIGEPTVSDNCGIESITNDAPPVFPAGIPTQVTWTATDVYGNTSSCIQIVTISVITVSASSSAQVSCHNASDGVIIVTPDGGTEPYMYSINGQQPQVSNVFSGLAAGAYVVTVIDSIGCIKILPEIIIVNPPQLQVVVEGSEQVSCHNSSDGMIYAIVSGGTGNYTYSLNGGPAQTSPMFNGLPPGNYIVTVHDANGCEAVADGYIIHNPDSVVVTAAITGQISCYHGSDGEISATGSGGTGAYTYSINGAVEQTSNVFSGLPAGVYIITIMDENGCTSVSEQIVLNGPPEIQAYTETSGQVSCNDYGDGEITVIASGGTGILSYSINGGPLQTSNVFSGLPAGVYTITIYDENGCNLVLDEINIINPNPLTAEFNSTQANCSGLNGGFAQVIVYGGTPQYTYQWSNGGSTAGIYDLAAGNYSVTVSDAMGCSMAFNTAITAEPRIELQVNRGFSPNGDGINDTWVIGNLYLYPENDVVVLNRWGNEIFTQKSYMNDWAGSDLLEGTYLYIIKVKMCEEDVVFKGYVTILR
ncbi:MAG TPA: gliding motility-associated C-terminal domain-containing protein, partial [Bacteroidales bacterium]|nr:gliding motility-associated C-terminal domain-containing protein [Bacteroidales bacterium]